MALEYGAECSFHQRFCCRLSFFLSSSSSDVFPEHGLLLGRGGGGASDACPEGRDGSSCQEEADPTADHVGNWYVVSRVEGGGGAWLAEKLNHRYLEVIGVSPRAIQTSTCMSESLTLEVKAYGFPDLE